MTPEHIAVACWAAALLLVGYLIQTIGKDSPCAVCRAMGRKCSACREREGV